MNDSPYEPEEYYEPLESYESQQTGPSSGGCLSGFLILPLMIICLGVMFGFAVQKLRVPDDQQSQAKVQAQVQDKIQVQTSNISVSGNSSLAPLFTPEIQYWAADLARWAAEHKLDPNLAATVMQIESCGNPDARSSAGAASLFQVMPFHFLAYENAYDPEVNALRGMNYLAKSLEQAGGNARLALAGYNGGIGVIARYESAWPAETIRYAYWGSGIYEDATKNLSESARLNEWLTAGGASLCRKARERLGIAK
jgi:hypothetical protein